MTTFFKILQTLHEDIMFTCKNSPGAYIIYAHVYYSLTSTNGHLSQMDNKLHSCIPLPLTCC